MNHLHLCCYGNEFVLLTLFLHLSTLTMSTGLQLSITPHGTQIKTVDSGMIFTCTIGAGADESSSSIAAAVPAASAPTIKWLAPRRQEITAKAGRVYIERPDKWNLRLYITRIQESDAGLYTCETQLEPGKDWITEETRMFLYEDIRFADTRTEVRSLLGTSALLECTATGQPHPEITWRFNRRRITPDDDKYAVEEDGLRINQLDLKDNGTYECRAEVESHGNVKIRSVSLEVIYPPVILQSPTADVVIKGQDTKLDCRADANPAVHYEWFKEQKMSEMIRVKVRLAEGTPSYVIRNVGASDEGRYFCRASNYLGTREAYVDIKMLVPPEIRSLPERVSVAEGKSLNVTCEATGIPLPKITWKLSTQHQSQDIDMTKLGAWMERTQPGQSALTIRNANRAHSGVLSCTAHNVAGTEARSVELAVEYAPSIDISLTEQLGWSGQTRVFSCVGRAIPLPSINWFRGEQYITDSDIYRITTTKTDVVTSLLTITLAENVPWAYGGYSCIAKNVHGYVTKDIRLTEATSPDMVRNVSVDKETATSVTLTAVAPSRTGGLPITSWMVTYESDSDPDAKPRSRIFHYGDRLHVTNLTAGSSYTFYLSASNAVGVSQPVKFRVTTPRRPALKEQSDVPERGDVDDDSFHDSLSSSTSIRGGGKTIDDHKTKERNRSSSTDDATVFDRSLSNSAGGASPPDVGGSRAGGGDGGMSVGVGTHGNNDSVLLAIAIGSTVVLTAIVVAMSCGFWWRRRRKASLPQWYAPAGLGPSAATPTAASYLSTAEAAEYFLGRPTDNCIMLLPTARQPTDPLPAVVALVDPDMTSQETEMVEYRSLTRMNASQTLPLVKSRTPKAARAAGSQATAAGPTTPRPCDQGFRTLQRCESGRVAVSHLQREDDGASGHAPLYVLKQVGGGKVGQVGGGGGSVGGQKAALFIDEILDGYHSGDNVDDDIDNVDYTIKIPSYHDQVKG